MIISINTSLDKIFKQYLSIINPVLGDKMMSNKEIEVLDKLLYINQLYIKVPLEDRMKILFDKLTRGKIAESLGMSKGSFDNVLHSLRKKHLISSKSLLISIPFKDGKIELGYKLIIDADNGTINN